MEGYMARSTATAGKAAQQRVLKLPREPQPSKMKAPPIQLPLDFYNPKWYNGLTATQKEKFVKNNQVAFLPNAAQSFIPAPNTHPDENISGLKFNKNTMINSSCLTTSILSVKMTEKTQADQWVVVIKQTMVKIWRIRLTWRELVKEVTKRTGLRIACSSKRMSMVNCTMGKRRRMGIGEPGKMKMVRQMGPVIVTGTLVWRKGEKVRKRNYSVHCLKYVLILL